MLDIQQRSVIRFFYLKGESNQFIADSLQEVYGPDAYSLEKVKYWTHQFKLGRTNINNNKSTGKPPLDYLDANILKVLTDYPFSSVRSIAEVLKEPRSTIYEHLTESLGLKNYSLKWVPHELTCVMKQKRKDEATNLLNVLMTESFNDFDFIVTGDESWFYLDYSPRTLWTISNENIPERVEKTIGAKKYMITVMWSKSRFYVIELLDECQSFNSEYFMNHILKLLLIEFKKTHKKSKKPILLHVDNARPHNSKKVDAFLRKNNIQRMPHPPYSSDLAPSDFFLFGYVKGKLEGERFEEPEDLLFRIREIIAEIPIETLNNVFNEWIRRCNEVIQKKGSYI